MWRGCLVESFPGSLVNAGLFACSQGRIDHLSFRRQLCRKACHAHDNRTVSRHTSDIARGSRHRHTAKVRPTRRGIGPAWPQGRRGRRACRGHLGHRGRRTDEDAEAVEADGAVRTVEAGGKRDRRGRRSRSVEAGNAVAASDAMDLVRLVRVSSRDGGRDRRDRCDVTIEPFRSRLVSD